MATTNQQIKVTFSVEQAVQLRLVTAGLEQMRDIVQGIGHIPPGPEREPLFASIASFSSAVMAAMSPARVAE